MVVGQGPEGESRPVCSEVTSCSGLDSPAMKRGMGAAHTFSDHESDLQVRVIDGLRGNGEEVDQLLDRISVDCTATGVWCVALRLESS